MLLTIDNKNKDIKISSIARDTYVDIPGHSTEKMTHAYAYGGIDLLKQVFEVNFDIKIDKYIAVNFVSFMDIMDEIGGVEVNVEEKEYITKSGLQRLNGYQALAFSRIRYTDSAYTRDNRHREVAEILLENTKTNINAWHQFIYGEK